MAALVIVLELLVGLHPQPLKFAVEFLLRPREVQNPKHLQSLPINVAWQPLELFLGPSADHAFSVVGLEQLKNEPDSLVLGLPMFAPPLTIFFVDALKMGPEVLKQTKIVRRVLEGHVADFDLPLVMPLQEFLPNLVGYLVGAWSREKVDLVEQLLETCQVFEGHPAQLQIPEWTGADVKVTSDFTWEPQDFIEAHNLLVRTRHAHALTWLFFEIRDAFGGWLDASNN